MPDVGRAVLYSFASSLPVNSKELRPTLSMGPALAPVLPRSDRISDARPPEFPCRREADPAVFSSWELRGAPAPVFSAMFKKQVFSGLNHSRQAFFLVLGHANSREIKRPNLAGELSVFPRGDWIGRLTSNSAASPAREIPPRSSDSLSRSVRTSAWLPLAAVTIRTRPPAAIAPSPC